MIAESSAQAHALKERAAEGGLRFDAYLPLALAEWLLGRIERGIFADPSEAVFVILGEYRELEPHADLREELLRRTVQAAIDEPRHRCPVTSSKRSCGSWPIRRCPRRPFGGSCHDGRQQHLAGPGREQRLSQGRAQSGSVRVAASAARPTYIMKMTAARSRVMPGHIGIGPSRRGLQAGINRDRRHVDLDAIDRVVRKNAAALGLDRGYSAQSMRATFITTALENGAQLEYEQKAAGHRDPSTTKPYDRRGYNPEKAVSFFATY